MTEYTPEEWEAMPGTLPQINSADVPYELKQADANVWGTLVPAKADDETKGAMSAIKDLFGRLAEAASIAQGDRKITNIYIDELEKIRKKLTACLDILLTLIAQLERKDSESQETLQQLQAKIHSAPNLDLIKTELEGLVELMGKDNVDRAKFRSELATLASEIKRLCDEGDRLKRAMESGSEEVSGRGPGGGISKRVEGVGTTSSSTSAPINLMGWTANTDDEGRTYYSCPGKDSIWDPPEEECVASTSTSRRESEPRLPESGIPITVEGKEYKTGYVVKREAYLVDAMGREDRNQGKKKYYGLQRGGPFKAITKGEGGAGRQGRWIEKVVEETRVPPDMNRKRKLELLKQYAGGAGRGEKSRLITEMRKWDRDNGYLNISESSDGVYAKEFRDIMDGGRRRRTRKKRAGWRTPEKGSPMRTLLSVKKQKKKKKHTKKNKKKRKKKGTRKRRNRKR